MGKKGETPQDIQKLRLSWQVQKPNDYLSSKERTTYLKTKEQIVKEIFPWFDQKIKMFIEPQSEEELNTFYQQLPFSDKPVITSENINHYRSRYSLAANPVFTAEEYA